MKNNNKIQFSWDGKEDALQECNTPPKYKYEVPNTIESNEIHCIDNLDFFKNNQERLQGRVKCIYIDPPYNTGKDFIYKDKKHGRGECKHSKWLSFMYPRLVLARELLREDGVIFISIDDNEQANLRLLMNEVFGEGCAMTTVIWQKKTRPSNKNNRGFSSTTEYIIMYQKEYSSMELPKEELNEEYVRKTYKNPDNDPRGLWRSQPLWSNSNTNPRKTLILPDGREITEKWFISQKTLNNLYQENKIIISNNGGISSKVFLSDSDGKDPMNLLTGDIFHTSEHGTKEVSKLFGYPVFSNPKPVALIKHLLQISTQEGDLVLDFFAGSGTTAQAVMELNFEETQKAEKEGLLADGKPAGGRKFILVQLPEKISEKQEAYKAGYRVISDITMERVRRAGEKYKGVETSFKIYK